VTLQPEDHHENYYYISCHASIIQSSHLIAYDPAHDGMNLLQSGADISVIALWLGHESLTTTHHYVEAGLAMKERALARLYEPDTNIRRYHTPDSLQEFLKIL